MKIDALIRYCLPLSLLVSCSAAFGAGSLPSVESFFKNPEVAMAAISPLGKQVAFVARGEDGAQLILVRDTADLSKGHVVTASTPDDRIIGLDWVNENRLVFVVKSYKTEFYGNTDLIAVNPDGTSITHLISGEWRHQVKTTGTNIASKILTAEYSYFRATHDGSDDIIVKKINFENALRQIDGTHLLRLNTRTQKISEILDTTQPRHVFGWVLDASDVPRIAYTKSQGNCSIEYLAPEATGWTQLVSGDCLTGGVFNPFYFETANSLFVTKRSNGTRALFRYDLAKKELAKEPFLNIPGMDFSGALVTDYVAKKVIGVEYDGDARATVWLEPKFKDMQQKVDGILKSTNNSISCGTDCLNASAVLITSTSDRQPIEFFVYNIASGKMVGLGGEHPKIKPAEMGMRDFAYFNARDGMKIPAYFTLPPGKPAASLPTIVLVHGGPWVRGSSWEWEAEAQFLASRGYVVIQPEFRGSEGFGYDFYKAGWKQWGLTMQDDLADAALWAVAKGWADPKRIAIMGASYGGYASLMGLIKNPEIFRCGVEWAGVTDLTLRYNTPQDDATVDSLNYDLKTLIGDPVADAAMFKQNSPLQNTDKLTQPLLIAHGAMDRRVPIVHATDLYSAVKSHNKNVEWIVYSDEGHGWYHENNRIDFWNHVETFLDKNLKNVN